MALKPYTFMQCGDATREIEPPYLIQTGSFEHSSKRFLVGMHAD